MDTKQYIPLAIKTESVPAELRMNQIILHASLQLATATGLVLDQVKRKLFYGKDLSGENVHPHLVDALACLNFIGSTLRDAPEETNRVMPQEEYDAFAAQSDQATQDLMGGVKLANLNIRLLHAALGGFTESAEKIEALVKQFETGELDLVNFAEENGDTQWYNAIELDELAKVAAEQGKNPADFTESALRLKNITKLQGNEKLKGRYGPNDFDAVAALNRDLDAERALLEGAP